MKVETRGSVGAGNAITPEEVAEADLVIVAADIEVDGEIRRQADVPHHHRSGAEENRPSWIKRWRKPNRTSHPANLRRLLKEKESAGAYRHLLTGVSYAADGSGRGLCIALSLPSGSKRLK